MDIVSAVGPKCVDRDTVTELFERGGDGGGGVPLMVVHSESVAVGVGGRP